MTILWPAFALVALTMFSVLRLARMRFAAVRGGRVDPGYHRIFRGDGEPAELAAASRNVVNLYQAPTLVMWRFRAFAASWLVLLAYWIALGAALATAGGTPAAAG